MKVPLSENDMVSRLKQVGGALRLLERARSLRLAGNFGALPREAQLREPISRLNEGIFAHADFDDVDS
jgi:hypothetical protein